MSLYIGEGPYLFSPSNDLVMGQMNITISPIRLHPAVTKKIYSIIFEFKLAAMGNNRIDPIHGMIIHKRFQPLLLKSCSRRTVTAKAGIIVAANINILSTLASADVIHDIEDINHTNKFNDKIYSKKYQYSTK